jgi:type III pantothenate kinase
MLIAIDVGNTNATVGVMKDTAILSSFKLPIRVFKSVSLLTKELRKHKAGALKNTASIESVYACSVVPSCNKNLRSAVLSVFDKSLVLVGEDVSVPVLNRYRIPGQVGQDRLVNAYAGMKLYGPGIIIIDFGTAITFDIVSRRLEYLGGLIFPGFRLMQESLSKNTALLPYVELARPMELIGRDTVSSIRAGLVFGVASLCDGIVERLRKKECKGFTVIATGGDSELIKPYSGCVGKFEDSLILKGLAFIRRSQKALS